MRFLTALRLGFHRLHRHGAVVAIAYLSALAPALALAWLVHGNLAASLDTSLFAERVFAGHRFGVWIDFLASPANELPALFHGFGLRLLVFLVLQIAISAGLVELLLGTTARGDHGFLRRHRPPRLALPAHRLLVPRSPWRSSPASWSDLRRRRQPRHRHRQRHPPALRPARPGPRRRRRLRAAQAGLRPVAGGRRRPPRGEHLPRLLPRPRPLLRPPRRSCCRSTSPSPSSPSPSTSPTSPPATSGRPPAPSSSPSSSPPSRRSSSSAPTSAAACGRARSPTTRPSASRAGAGRG